MQVILCTAPDHNVSKEIAIKLVKISACACVNIIPKITSVYRWQGEIHEETECLLLIKAKALNYRAIEKVILDIHRFKKSIQTYNS